MRRVVGSVLVLVITIALAGPVGAQEDEGEGDVFIPADPTESTELPVPSSSPAFFPGSTTTVNPNITTTTALPAGCPPPPAAHAVFVGQLQATDARTARFEVLELEAGSLAGFAVDGVVDVDFDDDVRFLEIDERYLVPAGIDDTTGRLVSRAKRVEPRFGGDEVIGIDDRDVACPIYDDPLITRLDDGRSIESGVFTPLTKRKADILRAFLQPAGVAFGALVLVVAVKRSFAWSGRRMARAWRRRRATTGLGSRHLGRAASRAASR